MTHFSRTRVAPLTVSLGIGALIGLAGPITEKWDNPVCVSLNVVLSDGWAWVCYAFLVGYCARSKARAALLSSLGLAIGVVAYYVFKDLSPTSSAGLESGATGEVNYSSMLAWGVAAFALGAPVGILGNLAIIPSLGGLSFRLIVPFVAIFETSMQLTAEAEGQRAVVGITWNVIRFIAGAVAMALVLHAIWSWRHSRRTCSAELERRARSGVSPL
ncbi:hypothetical protein E4U91_02205 [Streptomyces lasalocidi]|uniref:Uncharacterized protein n=1 Tax=Streptomyces lasalocidi TaxID=324833 RepID=A0A4U5WR55_STRLS|nr:hypothetical protein E4U91_02205 [Streptomyces lasalocidi]